MPRVRGRRNADFETTRDELVALVTQRLKSAEGGRASMRDLALAAGVSVPTLRHYFGTRDQLLAAVLAHYRRLGLRGLQRAARGPAPTLAASLRSLLDAVDSAFVRGAGRIHAVGLCGMLEHERLARAYLVEMLEPTLDLIGERLHWHMSRGEMQRGDARNAALALYGPLLLLRLHQNELGGAKHRPTSISAFLDEHVSRYAAAYGAGASQSADGGNGEGAAGRRR
jgi:AcrR family transcriptional regulator